MKYYHWLVVLLGGLATIGLFGAYHTIKPTIPVPGATNPNVTQANIQQTICVTGWTATIRPPASYTTALKIKQLAQFGYADKNTADFEEDHLVSLELGGNPTSEQNLWPQAYAPAPGAREKDKTENYLRSQVCSGNMTLAEAQKEISTNWLAVYNKIKTNVGGIDQQYDEDDN